MTPKYPASTRLFAMVVKELVQIRRDRLTFAMMVGIPLLQILLFGFAINLSPKDFSALIVSESNPSYGQTAIEALKENGHFSRVETSPDEGMALGELRDGRVQAVAVIDFPAFDLENPMEEASLRLSVDDSDPLLGSYVVNALEQVIRDQAELHGPNGETAENSSLRLFVERLYNPDGVTAYHIVPGLLGVILTMTMVMMSALTIVRERETGTMETLIASPGRPLELMLGKLTPYSIIGLGQTTLILYLADSIFHVPFRGSPFLLIPAALLFIWANLMLGAVFSTMARNQAQAMQMTFFFFLPSTLLSGFMFPFVGMPSWAQAVGEVLPLTHFLRITRGVLLKGFTGTEVLTHIWPIAVFFAVATVLSVACFRKTLD